MIAGTNPLETPDRTKSAEPLMRRRRQLLWAIVIFLIALVARVGLVDRHGLWADELFSLAMATGHSLEHAADLAEASRGDFVEHSGAVSPEVYAAYLEHKSPRATPAEVIRAVAMSDTSPPLYYLLLYGWTLVAGTGDAALRLFSVLFSLAAFPLLWSIAHELGGRRAAICTSLLYAISPLAVFYSTEGRMYALLWFLATALLWLSLRLHASAQGRRSLLTAWMLVGAAGFLTHYFFAFIWSGILVWLMLHPGRQRRGWLIIAAMASLALAVPWYLRLPQSLANWRVTGDWLTMLPWPGFSRLQAALRLPWSYVSVRGMWGVRPAADWAMAGVLGAVALLVWRRARWFEAKRQVLWLCVAAACGGLLLFDLWRGTYVVREPRYAIMAMPAALVLVGIALAQLSGWPQRVLVSLIVLLCIGGLRRVYVNPGRASEPMREAAIVLAKDANPDDLIVVHSIPSGVVGMGRYLHAASDQNLALAGWTSQLGRRHVPGSIKQLIAGRKRVFVVIVHDVGEPATQVAWLKQNATLASTWSIERVQVLEFHPADEDGSFPALDEPTDIEDAAGDP